MKNTDKFCSNYDISKFYEIIDKIHFLKNQKIFIIVSCIFFLFLDYTVLYKESKGNQAHGKDILMKTYFSLKGILNPAVNADSQPRTPRDMLLDDIRKTQCALEIAYSGFDNVTDPDLIDCYIYEVNSALKRYRFLLQQAAQMQLYEEYHMDSPEFCDTKPLVQQPIA